MGGGASMYCYVPDINYPGTVDGAWLPGDCARAVDPPGQLVNMQTADAALRNVCGRGTAPATTMPYAYPVGVASADKSGTFTFWNSWFTCNGLVGETADCPTPAGEPGACLFSPIPLQDGHYCDESTYHTPDHGYENGQCGWYLQMCTKMSYDTSFQTACCMGEVAGMGSFSTPVMAASGLPSLTQMLDQVVCAPSWCPLDPAGACEGVYATQCAGSVTNDGVTWVSALLADPSESACGAWYSQALAGQAPASRWPVIDTLIENYCSRNPGDTASCGCFLYSGGADGTGACDTGNCYLYTSVSQDGQANLRPVRPVNAATSNSLNLSDYACIAPQCHVHTLLPSDVWAMQNLGRCPDVCLQVVADGSVVISGDTISGGVYVNLASMSCGGALASATVATPYLMDVTDRINLMWPHYGACATCCPASGCQVTVPFVYALASNSADMDYTVTFDPPLPPGITVANPYALAGTLSYGGAYDANVELTVAGLGMAAGSYVTTVTIADTRPQYATCRASTVFDLLVYEATSPPPPQGPPLPNGGSGPPLVVKTVAPPWILYAVYAALALAALLLVRQLVLLAQRASVTRAIRASAATAADAAPASPYAPYASWYPPAMYQRR